jgi:hypothetical protein
MGLKVNRSSMESFFPVRYHHITSPIVDPRFHRMSPVGLRSLKHIDLNAHYGGRISVHRSKMGLSAGGDATLLNHVNSPKIIGSIEKLAAFGDML